MAVDKLKVIARLKALFPKANLSQKRLDAIADKLAKKPADDADDDAIDLVINDFNEILSIEDIAKDDDRLRTLESKSKEPSPTDPPTPKPQDPPAPSEDVPAWAKTLLEKVEKIETGKVTENKKQTVAELIEKSEVLKNLTPEVKKRWLERINVESETSFEDQIKELESEYSELVQTGADTNSYAGPAGSGSTENKPDATTVDEIVNNLNI